MTIGVARRVQPNYTSMLAAAYKAAIDACFAVDARSGGWFAPHQVYAGSPNPDLAVELDAGYVWDGTTLTEVAAQTVSGFTIPTAGQHRVDRVVVDATTGAASRVAGTAVAGSPSATPPAIPAGKIPVCQVLIQSSDTAVLDGMITDERAMPTAPATSKGINGATRNARMFFYSTSPTLAASFTADEVIVSDALGGKVKVLASFSGSLNIHATGIGGIDTGVPPASGFVSIYAAAKEDGTQGIFACNVTASSGSVYGGANPPSGYTYTALLGVWPTNAAGDLVEGVLLDHRKFQYRAFKGVFSGQTGGALASQSISSAVPSVARTVDLTWYTAGTSNTYRPSAAGDASGTGLRGGILETTGGSTFTGPGGLGSITSAIPLLDVPIITSQTIYWAEQLGRVSASSLAVQGYTV